jgi:ABC-type oligopeptide transport system substrate-binding subunit
MIRSLTRLEARNRLRMLPALLAIAAAVGVLAACSSSGTSSTGGGTIKRSDGSTQATFDGHPLYTFVGDTAPGQAKGNGLNAFGGLWHEVTTSGSAPAGSSSSGSGGGGYGY